MPTLNLFKPKLRWCMYLYLYTDCTVYLLRGSYFQKFTSNSRARAIFLVDSFCLEQTLRERKLRLALSNQFSRVHRVICTKTVCDLILKNVQKQFNWEPFLAFSGLEGIFSSINVKLRAWSRTWICHFKRVNPLSDSRKTSQYPLPEI